MTAIRIGTRASLLATTQAEQVATLLETSQRFVRRDPWAERAAGRELNKFRPVTVLSPILPLAAE